MALPTEVAVRNAKPREKPFKPADERALYLLVTPTGGKLWRFNCRFGDKHKTIAFGGYPDVSLARAREKRDEARLLRRRCFRRRRTTVLHSISALRLGETVTSGSG